MFSSALPKWCFHEASVQLGACAQKQSGSRAPAASELPFPARGPALAATDLLSVIRCLFLLMSCNSFLGVKVTVLVAQSSFLGRFMLWHSHCCHPVPGCSLLPRGQSLPPLTGHHAEAVFINLPFLGVISHFQQGRHAQLRTVSSGNCGPCWDTRVVCGSLPHLPLCTPPVYQ